ncbi:MAG: flagellar hook-associated protein FlgL [Candidatus Caldarchaeum sp.]
MRISTDQRYEQLLTQILSIQGRIFDLEQQLATGRRIAQAGDDPIATVDLLSLKSALALAEQHKKSAETASANLKLVENAFGEITSFLNRAKTLVVQGATETTSSEARQVMAREIRQLQQQLLTNANIKSADGSYLLAGFETRTQPFILNPSPPPYLTYQGDQGQRLVEVGPGLVFPSNVLADEEIVSAYNALEDAAQRLEANDVRGLSGSSLQLLDDALGQINIKRGTIGALIQQFDSAMESALRRIDHFTEQISNREDADISETIVRYQQAQNAYQAALAAFRGTSSLSLLDFLGR